MIEYLKLLVELINHLAWPIVVAGLLVYFRYDIFLLLKRINKVKFGKLELGIGDVVKEVEIEAIDMGMTVFYPVNSLASFDVEMMKVSPAWVLLKSLRSIEDILIAQNKKREGQPIAVIVEDLARSNIIDYDLAELILKMFSIRNDIESSKKAKITEHEAIIWLSVTKSVKARLQQRL